MPCLLVLINAYSLIRVLRLVSLPYVYCIPLVDTFHPTRGKRRSRASYFKSYDLFACTGQSVIGRLQMPVVRTSMWLIEEGSSRYSLVVAREIGV
jgi:hypothetical protein